MAQLLIYEKNPPAQEQVTNRFGGLPLVPRGSSITWPLCKTCNGAMKFLGQLVIPSADQIGDHLLLLFMCERTGTCDDWDAELGGNCAMVITETSDVVALKAPDNESCRNTIYGAYIAEVISEDYQDARKKWTGYESGLYVLGQLLGEPDWIQFDQTPNCNACGQPMNFVAQLEEGPNNAPHYNTSMNFGGGCAYVFDCRCAAAGGGAKMLWQQ